MDGEAGRVYSVASPVGGDGNNNYIGSSTGGWVRQSRCGMVVQHERVQHTTSQPASPSFPRAGRPQRDGGSLPEQTQDPPLFGTGARRIMDGCARRALHGSPSSGGGGTDADSSGSIPKELAQEGVRRQVHHASLITNG